MRKEDWPMYLYIAFILMLVGGGIIAGAVKFAAWWRIAFGTCP